MSQNRTQRASSCGSTCPSISFLSFFVIVQPNYSAVHLETGAEVLEESRHTGPESLVRASIGRKLCFLTQFG